MPRRRQRGQVHCNTRTVALAAPRSRARAQQASRLYPAGRALAACNVGSPTDPSAVKFRSSPMTFVGGAKQSFFVATPNKRLWAALPTYPKPNGVPCSEECAHMFMHNKKLQYTVR